MTPRPTVAERRALADLLWEVGPDAPTECAGWTTRDLAAHLIIRERRPDAALGIVVRSLRGHGDRVRLAVAARPYPDLVAAVRRPPWWSWSAVPLLDRFMNSMEFFVHHEDVRRAQPGWQPRDLPPFTERPLWRVAVRVGKRSLRRFRAVVLLHAPGYGEVRVSGATTDDTDLPRVRVSGPPGELVLFVCGRQRLAKVDISGPERTVASLTKARLGI